MSWYYPGHNPPPAAPPAPVPPAAQWPPHPPQSAYTPQMFGYSDPSTPIIIDAHPPPSPTPSARSAARSHYGHARERSWGVDDYAASGRGAPHLDPDYRQRGYDGPRGRMVLETRRHGRDHRSRGRYEDDEEYSDELYSDDEDYDYVDNRREPSRGHSHSRPVSRANSQRAGALRRYAHSRSHSRASSAASDTSADDRLAVEVKSKINKEDATKKEMIEKLQEQLSALKLASEKKREAEIEQQAKQQEEAAIQRRVQKQMMLEKQREEEAARKAAEEAQKERERIAAAAKKLLEEEAAAAAAEAAAKAAKEAEIEKIREEERAKFAAMQAAQPRKKTYMRFNKMHVCKEALEERNLDFVEEEDNFLVRQYVEKADQSWLFARSKEIRAYYRKIQEAADRAPIERLPDGSLVKYVQIAGQPYPLALPVTYVDTPGGGRSHRTEPIKFSWSKMFGTSRPHR